MQCDCRTTPPCWSATIMNANESAIGSADAVPILAAPVPRQGPMPFFEFMRILRDNQIATYAQEAYELDIIERKMFGRYRFIVNDPAAVKRVLLDNVANY
jgi:hypothetical protein